MVKRTNHPTWGDIIRDGIPDAIKKRKQRQDKAINKQTGRKRKKK